MHIATLIFGYCALALLAVAIYFWHASYHDQIDDFGNAVAALFFGGLAGLFAIVWICLEAASV